MRILVLNSGSSSAKFSLFEDQGGGTAEPPRNHNLKALLEGEATGLGTVGAKLVARDSATGADRSGGASLEPNASADMASRAIAELIGSAGGVDAIGYRVVHPGPNIREHCLLTPEVLEQLRAATMFAPLHQPPMLHLMAEMGQRLPRVPAFCCFDTVFHETMPEEARTYALPRALRDKGVRRYGFHGVSCEGVVRRLRERADGAGARSRPFPRRLIVAHLGSGCSVTAIRDGASQENTMGLTPDGGVVMGTRPGDLDPGVVLFLVRDAVAQRGSEDAVSAVESVLNRDAGTAGLAGMANDMKAIREAARGGQADAALAVKVFTRSTRKAIGAYVALLGGVDALVFTGGIGEHDAESRREILEGLDGLGLRPDVKAGGDARAGADAVQSISAEDAAAEVLVIAAEEDLTIAIHVAAMMGAEAGVSSAQQTHGTTE